ncbi:UNVERIFIED_CONTAM: hypothetical protein Slati_0863000 [Sesamum latifolium]|uniref:Uncharacterized protein n=1 Tax=Sesamum latifolium TaxID=2727402 RepID=A0AAW2XMY1_9LAMI
MDVSEDVLRRGGSVVGAMARGGGGAGARVTGVDPASTRVGGAPATTCRACVPLGTATAFCLSEGWLGFLWELTPVTHKLSHRRRQLMRATLTRVQLNLGFTFGPGLRNKT